jgi:hypothetical protein
LALNCRELIGMPYQQWDNRGWSLDRAATRLDVSRRLPTQIEAGSAKPVIFTAHHAHEYRNTSDRVAEFHLAVFDPIDDGTVR